MDPTEAPATAFGDPKPRGSGLTRIGRFSVPNRVNPAVCRDLFGDLLGEYLVVAEIGSPASQFRGPVITGYS